MAGLPVLDWFFLAVLLLSLVMGAWRGLVFELISLVSWLLAFVLAQWFALDASKWLPMSGADEMVRYGAGFALVFVLALFAGGLLASLTRKLITTVGLRPVDRALGGLFGLARGALFTLAIVALVGMTPLKTSGFWVESYGAAWASSALVSLRPLMPESFAKYLS